MGIRRWRIPNRIRIQFSFISFPLRLQVLPTFQVVGPLPFQSLTNALQITDETAMELWKRINQGTKLQILDDFEDVDFVENFRNRMGRRGKVLSLLSKFYLPNYYFRILCHILDHREKYVQEEPRTKNIQVYNAPRMDRCGFVYDICVWTTGWYNSYM